MVEASVVRRMVPVVFENESVVAVIKPAGVDTGDARDGSVAGLVEWFGAVRPDGAKLHATNRLSRYESGILLLAKSRLEADRVRKQLQQGRIELEYTGIVRGRLTQKSLTLTPQGTPQVAKGDLRIRPAKRQSKAPKHRPASQAANGTLVTLVEQHNDRALVRIRTRLENTHALRALLRGSGLRLLGDKLHELAQKPVSPKQTHLHLTRMILPQGSRERAVVLKAPSPDYTAALRGGLDIERPLLAAATRRLTCLADPDLDAYRLLSGDVEDYPGLTVERYGDALILQVHAGQRMSNELLKRTARWYLDYFPIQAVYRKLFVKDRSRADAEVLEELTRARPFLGNPVPPVLSIHEWGLRFAIRPYDGFNVGLFLDQRDNRAHLRELAPGKSVLNLFAYTCGFSVAAAVGGAARTVSVDVSSVNLARGRENFALNKLLKTGPQRAEELFHSGSAKREAEGACGTSDSGSSPNAEDRVAGSADVAFESEHVFIRAGAVEYLRRAGRRGERFDIVVVDPPSFAHGRRGEHRFSVMEDLTELIAGVLRVLSENGIMLVSTNHRRLTLKGLRERIHAAADGRRYEVLLTPALPPDFAVDPDYAKSMWLRFR